MFPEPGAPADKRYSGHAPVFKNFQLWAGTVPPNYLINWLGEKTLASLAGWPSSPEPRQDVPPLPAQDSDEYVEWTTILESALEAQELFTVVELGAGWGRWIVSAGLAARQLGKPSRLIGVEAEPHHFKAMRDHVSVNGLDSEDVRLIEAAVADVDGEVTFMAEIPTWKEWYGQAIAPDGYDGETITVPALSIGTILEGVDYVDLIDLDIQGSELLVLKPAMQVLYDKVRRVFVGTHSLANEAGLRDIFTVWGWFCEHDYSLSGDRFTKYGWARFGDGVQVWRNRRFDDRVPGAT